ncbi:PLAC8-domain-containing protein [Sistotremastrum suecicum HHB10207 ss-3]|nr:PLAC8-domain-containing protein [Sistotremastrum suecicum HHB10207 ss-3]
MQVPPQGDRNPNNMPFDGNGERAWSNGLCSCFGSCGTCLEAAFCPCITYGRNKARLDYLRAQGKPDPSGGECCTGDCMLHCVLTVFLGLGCLVQIGNRGRTRERYRIRGGCCGDCMASWCCQACALTQESREIEGEEDSYSRRY